MLKNVDFSYILKDFGVQNFDIYKIKEKISKKPRIVYKIKSFDNFFCLKQSYLKIEELLFIYSYLRWLHLYGFEVPYFIMSIKNQPFLEFNNKFFTLTKWIDGKKLNYDNLDECIKSLILLGKIHNYTNKIPLIKDAIPKNNQVNLKYKFKKYNKELDKIIALANMVRDTFSNILILNFDTAKFLSSASIKYSSIINFEDLNISICHGDYVNKNIIITDKNVVPIDFDKSCINFSISDLAYFFRRYLRRSNVNWNYNLFVKLLRYYDKSNCIFIDEYLYLISYLSFPQKFLKLSCYYYKNINSLSDIQKSNFEKLLSKTCISMYNQIAFLNNFEKEIISNILK